MLIHCGSISCLETLSSCLHLALDVTLCGDIDSFSSSTWISHWSKMRSTFYQHFLQELVGSRGMVKDPTVLGSYVSRSLCSASPKSLPRSWSNFLSVQKGFLPCSSKHRGSWNWGRKSLALPLEPAAACIWISPLQELQFLIQTRMTWQQEQTSSFSPLLLLRNNYLTVGCIFQKNTYIHHEADTQHGKFSLVNLIKLETNEYVML